MRRGWHIIPLVISVVLGLTACGGAEVVAGPTAVLPTPFATATALPPMARPPARGSEENPHRLLLVSRDGISESDATLLANQMGAAYGDNISIALVDSYAEARRQLCGGQAEIVLLDAFNAMAARTDDCGELLAVAEIDGATFTQGNFVARDSFRPEFNAGRFCRASAESLHGWVIPRIYLLSRGKDPLEFPAIVDVGSDEAVIASVLDRSCQMGAAVAGVEATLTTLPDLRFLQILPAIPPLPPVPNDALLLNSRLEGDALATMADLVDDFDDELAALLGYDALREVTDEDYEALATLLEAAQVDLRALAR